MTIKCARHALLAGSLMLLAGCQSFYTPLEALTGHDNPVVSVPSNVGAYTVGAVLGVPATVIALPVTLPLASDQNASLLPLAPVFVFGQVGAITIGGLPWLLVGWW